MKVTQALCFGNVKLLEIRLRAQHAWASRDKRAEIIETAIYMPNDPKIKPVSPAPADTAPLDGPQVALDIAPPVPGSRDVFIPDETGEFSTVRDLSVDRPPHAALLRSAMATSLNLALGGERIGHVLVFKGLGDQINQQGSLIRVGLHAWGDLETLLQYALKQSTEPGIELSLDQYDFPDLEPPASFIEAISRLMAAYPSRTLSLIWNGDPLDPPIVYSFSRDSVFTTGLPSHEISIDTRDPAYTAWQTEPLASLTKNAGRADQKYACLLASLAEADQAAPNAGWGDFLSLVIHKYNDKARAGGVAEIPPDRRDNIFDLLSELQGWFRSQAATVAGPGLVPGALYFDPITLFHQHHPPSNAPKNGWYSIGAGQMIAILEIARELIRRGKLPLDFRLTADNRVNADGSRAPIREINVHGTRRKLFGETQINGSGRRIHVLSEAQRLQAIDRYKPAVVHLNVKAGQLRGIFSDELLEILDRYDPAITLPAKAYDDKGRIPYLVRYLKLLRAFPQLAPQLAVIGGFYEADKMLRGIAVDMIVAAGSEEALEQIREGLSPNELDPLTERADWERLKLKMIASVELAIVIMAAGANKNFLTYGSAHLLMDLALACYDEKFTETGLTELTDLLSEKIAEHLEQNISISEEVTARISRVYFIGKEPVDTLRYWTPKAVKLDFRCCLPPNGAGLIEIARKVHTMLANRDLAGLAPLIEAIRRDKLGGGTRNARDGYLDAMLKFIHKYMSNDPLWSSVPSYSSFYETHYPEEWTGEGAQEGRNGIGPLIAFALEENVRLPKEVYETWDLYHPDRKIRAPEEKQRDYLCPEAKVLMEQWKVRFTPANDGTIPDGTSLVVIGELSFFVRDSELELHPVWGLPRIWVDRLSHYIEITNRILLEATPELITQKKIQDSVQKLADILAVLKPETGRFPRVTDRLIAIRDQAQRLVTLLRETEISESIINKALESFRRAISKSTRIVGHEITSLLAPGQPASGLEALLNQLRRIDGNLYRVEIHIRRGLKNGETRRLASISASSGTTSSGQAELRGNLAMRQPGMPQKAERLIPYSPLTERLAQRSLLVRPLPLTPSSPVPFWKMGGRGVSRLGRGFAQQRLLNPATFRK